MKLENDKLHAGMTVALFALILLVFTVVDIAEADRLFSQTENRILAQRPKWSLDNILDGSYEKEYETYATDQFVSRDTWVMLKTRMDILLQKKVIKGVYLAADGYLIERHLPEEYSGELIDERLDQLRQLTERYPQTLVMLAPTADNILAEKLPQYAVSFDQSRLLERVKGEIGEEHVIDLFPTLREHREEYIYYRTDHHWTTLGAYYA